ncbi:hypothetical protein BY996DRAFT_6408148 [Phakopsora pachyrhizi]|nr:hypothetical protein BY996DRAFT_6408148 [Phakopsora pachyrhizi]
MRYLLILLHTTCWFALALKTALSVALQVVQDPGIILQQLTKKAVLPAGLPSDWYAKEFLLFLTPAKKEALRMKAPVFEGASNCTVDFAPYLLIEENQQIYDKNLENNDGEDEIAWLNDTDKGKGKNKGGITNKDEDLLMEEANSLFDGSNDGDEEEEL